MLGSKNKKTFIEIDTTEMSAPQIRLIKGINTLIAQIVTTENEAEYFDGSAEAMRMLASLIQQANFVFDAKEESTIPYDSQALEYSVDILQDFMSNAKVISYDN